MFLVYSPFHRYKNILNSIFLEANLFTVSRFEKPQFCWNSPNRYLLFHSVEMKHIGEIFFASWK